MLLMEATESDSVSLTKKACWQRYVNINNHYLLYVIGACMCKEKNGVCVRIVVQTLMIVDRLEVTECGR